LTAWRNLLEKAPDLGRAIVRQKMQHWQRDTDFASVRDRDSLANFPEAERQEWLKLWAEVKVLGKRAAGPK
jgi:hypothetical protein